MSNEMSCDSVARRVNGENPLDVLVSFPRRMARCSPTIMVGPYVLPSTETDHAASGIVPSRS